MYTTYYETFGESTSIMTSWECLLTRTRAFFFLNHPLILIPDQCGTVVLAMTSVLHVDKKIFMLSI